MIVLQPISTTQTIKFIARKDNADTIVIRDEQDNTEVTITDAVFFQEKYYYKTDVILSLKEGRFYNLTIYYDGEVVYKDKIFCTSQTNGYSINSGDYVQHSSNNDYITV